MIYVIRSASGEYEDYRTEALFYTTNRKKAERWCEAATAHAREQHKKYEKINNQLHEASSEEEYHKIYKKLEKVKSKYDKFLHAGDLEQVTYTVLPLKAKILK